MGCIALTSSRSEKNDPDSFVFNSEKNIIPNAETLSPAYIVFDNYEIILKWNRSNYFAIAVGQLSDQIIN